MSFVFVCNCCYCHVPLLIMLELLVAPCQDCRAP
uniref:Uncharacterized protein n=1 Tax=Arundo donax TaxID=35708 RepID=A0A0A9FFX3_ARUDO